MMTAMKFFVVCIVCHCALTALASAVGVAVGDPHTLHSAFFDTPDCTGEPKRVQVLKTDGTCYDNKDPHGHDHYVTATCYETEATIYVYKDDKCTKPTHNHSLPTGKCSANPHRKNASAMFTCPSSQPNKDVKVISFTGQGAGIDDVDNQHMCFKKDLISGVTIRGTKASRITAQALQGYDVVLMPGGSSFYTQQSDVDVQAIQAFVKAGGGYYGTCAGAYGGCTTINSDENGVINPYTMEKVEAVGEDENGQPIYPNEAGMGVSRTSCDMFYQVGKTDNKFSSAGQKVFGIDDVEIDHHNGPAMHAQGSTVAATFADTQQRGTASIVLDTFGSGRSILISPHPEHTYLQNCGIVARAAAYAAGAIGDFNDLSVMKNNN